jgi:Tfp pilus assembly protein PilW
MQQHDRFAHLMLALEQRRTGFTATYNASSAKERSATSAALRKIAARSRGPRAAQAGCARAASRLALAISAASAVALRINNSPVAGSMIDRNGPEAGTQSPLKTHSHAVTWASRWFSDADI